MNGWKKAGVPREQATAIAEAQKDAFSEALDSILATKADVERIERKQIEHDGKFDKLSWMMGILIALAVASFAKQFFWRIQVMERRTTACVGFVARRIQNGITASGGFIADANTYGLGLRHPF